MMITAENVSKAFKAKHGRNHVLENLSFEMPEGGHLAILGAEGTGKSTLLNLIGEVDVPDQGKIRRFGTVSWVAGRLRFERGMTIGQNLRFLGRVVGQKDFAATEEHVAEITGFGRKMKDQFGELTEPEKKVLNFATLLAFDFDILLFDGWQIGRPELKAVFDKAVEEKLPHSMFVTALSKPVEVSDFYTHILVLADHSARMYEDRHEAFKAFKASVANKG